MQETPSASLLFLSCVPPFTQNMTADTSGHHMCGSFSTHQQILFIPAGCPKINSNTIHLETLLKKTAFTLFQMSIENIKFPGYPQVISYKLEVPITSSLRSD